ncbi:MAG: glycosyltransferase, partial [Proteobacteria bacterium]|nr:glycosyltransferase [Pseudomonadota bacterium]
LGFDVADESVALCRSRFTRDPTKQFRNAVTWEYERAHLALSLDVIFHLIEDEVFHEYMRRLFASAERYVIVYSSNYEGGHIAPHVKHRKFTEWVDIYHADFKLIEHIPNRWPLVDDDQNESFADFYIFERQPASKHTLPGHLVVSLTSYPPRFPTLELTLRRILQQSVLPDETVLWVSSEDRQQLPQGVLALQHSGLTIRETRDIRSYKKIIPVLERYPDSFIVTVDDDTAYPRDLTEVFVANYRGNDEVLCRRAHKVTFDESGNPRPYTHWQFETAQETGSDLFATGVGGIFYPPHSLAVDVLDEAGFISLAPLADDVWLFWMEHRAGATVRRVGPRYAVQNWPGCNEQGLFVTHNASGGNDPVIAALMARYGSPFVPGFALAPRRVGETLPVDEHLESRHVEAPRPRFRWLKRLARPFARPILRAFANRFMPRAEAVQNAQGLAAELREVKESLTSVQQALAQLRGHKHGEFSEARLAEEALKTSIAGFGARVGELERSAAFDRQAIHDLGQKLLGGARDRAPTASGVGVVVATCDRPVQLRAALESLAAQTRKPEIVVVVNDGHGSVDEVIRHFDGRLLMSTLKTPVPQSGTSVAHNVALDSLQTPLIAFLDDDNLMWPHWLESAAAVLENDETLDIIYGAQLRDSEDSATDKFWFLAPFDLERLRHSNFVDLNQLMHRASDVRFDTQMRRLVDWDYVLKLIDRLPGRIAPVDAISSIYSARARGRITVANWPPDLGEIAASRRNGLAMSLPEGGHHACSCGYQGEFLPGPDGRPAAGCPQCGSLERHRFLCLVAPLLRSFWMPASRPRSDTSMLEVAPSNATKPVRDMFGNAVAVDATPHADGRTVDVIASLTDLPLPSASFDCALALHVLEHIPNDRAAMREIARVLRPSGIAIVQVPLSEAATTDEVVLNSPQARQARYGQADHVRLYGQDFQARLNAAGLSTVSITPRESMPREAFDRRGLMPDETLVLAVRSDSAWAKARLVEFAAMLRKGAL